MEVKRGTIVRSLAGHDKGDFQVIIDFNDEYVKVCDGKYRPLERPKNKKFIHVKLTNTVINEDSLKTNRSIKAAIRAFDKAKN